jgi:hypothetical protein
MDDLLALASILAPLYCANAIAIADPGTSPRARLDLGRLGNPQITERSVHLGQEWL